MGTAMTRCFAALARKAFANANAVRCPRPMSKTDAHEGPSAVLTSFARRLRRAARTAVGAGRSGEDFLRPRWCPGTRAIGRLVKVFPYLSIH